MQERWWNDGDHFERTDSITLVEILIESKEKSRHQLKVSSFSSRMRGNKNKGELNKGLNTFGNNSSFLQMFENFHSNLNEAILHYESNQTTILV
jgi:hypothetical protein